MNPETTLGFTLLREETDVTVQEFRELLVGETDSNFTKLNAILIDILKRLTVLENAVSSADNV